MQKLTASIFRRRDTRTTSFRFPVIYSKIATVWQTEKRLRNSQIPVLHTTKRGTYLNLSKAIVNSSKTILRI